LTLWSKFKALNKNIMDEMNPNAAPEGTSEEQATPEAPAEGAPEAPATDEAAE